MFKVNTARTFRYPVSVNIVDENGKDQSGKFTAVFKVLPRQETPPDDLLEQVLTGLEGIELADESGTVLEGQQALDAAIADPSISIALVDAYSEAVLKKNRRKN